MAAQSFVGDILGMQEIPLDQSEKGQVGYLPNGYEGTDVGVSTATTIAGGDTRVFSIMVQESNVRVVPNITPPPAPRGCALHLRRVVDGSIWTALDRRASFQQWYDGVVVDASYLTERADVATLERDAAYLKRRNIGISVDASASINLFPQFRLLNNSQDPADEPYARMQAFFVTLLERMSVLGAYDLYVSLHRCVCVCVSVCVCLCVCVCVCVHG
jgi:hypothetical protein